MFKKLKIKCELKNFKNFKQNYIYLPKNFVEKDGELFLNSELVIDKDGKKTGVGNGFVDVGFSLKGSFSKLLSNLFPYTFVFRGKRVSSIESIFQGIKFKDKKNQNMVFKYSGKEAYHVKLASEQDWRKTGLLFWRGKPIKRFSKEYEDFVDEMYISAIQNPLYRQAILNCADKHIIHTMGETNNKETVLTRFEFEKQLNTLKDFLNAQKK